MRFFVVIIIFVIGYFVLESIYSYLKSKNELSFEEFAEKVRLAENYNLTHDSMKDGWYFVGKDSASCKMMFFESKTYCVNPKPIILT